MTWVVLSLAFGIVFSLFLPCCFSCVRRGIWGKEIEMPRIDGRNPHFCAGKCSLGAGLEESLEAEKPSSCHSPLGLDAAG